MDHTADGHEPVIREEEAIQHPLGVYFKIWTLLFVLSAMSYAVDYYQVQGYLRWFLILFFMVLKAGLIIAVFMHMVWERLAMVYFILLANEKEHGQHAGGNQGTADPLNIIRTGPHQGGLKTQTTE